jgi:hypothetical protein
MPHFRFGSIVLKNSFGGAAHTAAKLDLIEWPLFNATRSGDGL